MNTMVACHPLRELLALPELMRQLHSEDWVAWPGPLDRVYPVATRPPSVESNTHTLLWGSAGWSILVLADKGLLHVGSSGATFLGPLLKTEEQRVRVGRVNLDTSQPMVQTTSF